MPTMTAAQKTSYDNAVAGLSNGAAAPLAAIPVASSTTPTALGTAAVGTGTTFARADHVHSYVPIMIGPFGALQNPTVTTNRFLNFGNVNTTAASTTINAAQVPVAAGFIRGIVVSHQSGLPTDSITYTVWVNGVATSITGTIAASSTTAIVITNAAVAVNNGDLVAIELNESGTQTATTVNIRGYVLWSPN